MVFHWSLSDSEFVPVSSTLLSIQPDLNTALVWMLSIRCPISISSRPISKPLEVVPSALITIGITVAFMFRKYF